MSDKNVKYINFKYIILAPPEILVKIHYCWWLLYSSIGFLCEWRGFTHQSS